MAELNEKVPKEQVKTLPENLTKDLIIEALGGVKNEDLLDLLCEWRMENSLYVYPLMEMRGYEIDYSYDTVTFKHPKTGELKVAVKTLRDICFKVVKERTVDFRLERLLGSYLQCNAQQTYCVFDQWGYFPNGNKEILQVEEPDVFIVDKQRKFAVSHATLLNKLNDLLQLNEATNAKYTKLWQEYRLAVAEPYPEEFKKILLSDEPLRKALSQNFYHRDSYGLCFIELSGQRVLRFPLHIIKDLTNVKLEYVPKEEPVTEEEPAKDARKTERPVVPVSAPKAQAQPARPKEESKAKQANKASEQTNQQNRQERSKSNGRPNGNNQRSYNGRRGRYDNDNRRGGKSNAKFNTDRYLISEDELNYIVPVGWRNQLLNLGAFGRFILDVWIAFKLVGRIRKNRN